MIYSGKGFANFFFAANEPVGLDWLYPYVGWEDVSAPIAFIYFLSSVKKAVPFGLVFSLLISDLNCEYCDYKSLLIC